MSSSFSAKAIIGIELDMSKLMEIRMGRSCSCEKPPKKSMKFCPGCGKKAWRKEQVSLSDVDWVEGFYRACDLYCGFKVVKIEGYADNDWDFHHVLKVILVAIGVSTGDVCYQGEPDAFLPFDDDLNDTKEDMKKILEPQDLWDESKFGLYAIGRT